MKFKVWLEVTEDEFVSHHRTGFIRSDAYERYESNGGLSWLGDKSKFPILIEKKSYGSFDVEFRARDEKLGYSKTDDDGKILRDANGISISMSDEEILDAGLPLYDQSIIAFVDDKPIGLASNEFGTIGVWVERSYQKKGIGSDLLVMFMERDKRFLRGENKIGQMSDAGEKMSRSAYRKLVQRHGIDFDKV